MLKTCAIHPLTLALGVVFTVSLANTGIARAADNPFGMQALDRGYLQLAQGKCGEGKCGAGKGGKGKFGMARMDSDGDGKVTREEFMKGHEAMFDRIDQNDDGVIDETERGAHMKMMKGCMKDGKGGKGKCGAAR